MKRLAGIFIYCLLANMLYSQAPYAVAADTAYIRVYGGNNFDEARDLKETYDKGYILVGTTSSFGQGSTSLYVVKTDSLGIHQWSKNYGGLNIDWGYSVENAYSNGYLFVGYTNSFVDTNGYDGYIVRTDSAGNLLWQKTFGGDDWDYLYNSYPMADSGYVLCGASYTHSAGNKDAWLIRINKAGDTLWTTLYGGQDDEEYNDVVVLKNSIYAAGKQYNPIRKRTDAIITKYDFSGNSIGSYLYGPKDSVNYEYKGIGTTANMELILTGQKDSLPVKNLSSSIIMRMDTSFSIQWTDPGGYSQVSMANKSVENSKHEIITVGTVVGGLGGTSLFPIHYYGNGIWISSPTYGGAGDEAGNSLIMSSKKYLVFVGSTNSTNLSYGDKDMYLVLMKKDSVYSDQHINLVKFQDTLPLVIINVAEHTSLSSTLLIAPNPFSAECRIDILGKPDNNELLTVVLYDILGKEVYRNQTKQSSFMLNKNQLSAGTYLLCLTGDSIHYRTLVIIE